MIVLSGKDKGKSGKVIRALPARGRVIVEGVNMLKRHKKPRSARDKGQIVDFAAPVDVSNIGLVDPQKGRGSRVGYRFEKGKKVRYAKKSGSVLA